MSSELKLKEGLAAVIGGTVGDVDTLVEASKIAAAKYVPILRDAQRRIEALEAEVRRINNLLVDAHQTANKWMKERDKESARAERLLEMLDAIKDAADLQTATDMARKALEDDKQ